MPLVNSMFPRAVAASKSLELKNKSEFPLPFQLIVEMLRTPQGTFRANVATSLRIVSSVSYNFYTIKKIFLKIFLNPS